MEYSKKNRLSVYVFVILCLILLDSILITGGRLFSVGSLSYRMILTALACFLVTPFILKDFRNFLKNEFVMPLILFGVVLVIGFIRAIVLHQNLQFAIEMVKGCLYLALFPIMIYVVSNLKHIELLFRITILCATALSLFIIAVSVIAVHRNELITPLYYFIKDANIGMLYMATDKIARLLLLGVMSQIFACGFSFYMYMTANTYRWRFLIYGAINLVGILQTYTRGVYLGAFIAASLITVAFLLSNKILRKQVLLFMCCVTIIFVATVTSLGYINGTSIFTYGLFRTTMGTPFEPIGKKLFESTLHIDKQGDLPMSEVAPSPLADDVENDLQSNMESLDIRFTMKQKLEELISCNPILGNGLGAAIDLRDGRVEMVYHDMISKVGILGAVLFFSPVALMLYKLIVFILKRKRGEQLSQLNLMQIVLFCCFIGLLVSTYTNPYLLNSLGLFFYSLTMRVFMNGNFKINETYKCKLNT